MTPEASYCRLVDDSAMRSRGHYPKVKRRVIKLAHTIVIITDMLDYKQMLITDIEHRPLRWSDNAGNREEFRYEVASYNKKGEPEYRSVVVNSTIKLVINEKKFYSLREYENETQRVLLPPSRLPHPAGGGE